MGGGRFVRTGRGRGRKEDTRVRSKGEENDRIVRARDMAEHVQRVYESREKRKLQCLLLHLLRPPAPVPPPRAETRAMIVMRKFQWLRSPTFVGYPDLMVAENWLEQVTRTLNAIGVHEYDLRISCAIF
ncbi:hypothetical protein F0562_003342 [Nyssa sinensis]|uniref:Uncharacterized protein n=1 Tax=Nyssa sinensis TaxID=561372 RepID=A0A5J5BUW8_9ASTE|nr:hypothetical protein F0562_003342 [Nyssa sinensis]